MPADRAAFRKLVSAHTIPKTRVTCVTRVTTSGINDLAGHKPSAACVTKAPVGAASHAPRDHYEQECVTRKTKGEEALAAPGHEVTRSRPKLSWPIEGSLDGLPGVTALAEWLSYYEERAAIREYEGGFDRAEAETLALDETLTTLGPKPGTGKP
ncbi:hypothetical protein ACRAWG_16760 [Methylobacterium sp. P31]